MMLVSLEITERCNDLQVVFAHQASFQMILASAQFPRMSYV